MKLTNHEKQILKILLDNSRETDVEIAKSIGISAQATGMIRKELENKRVIKNYTCELDYKTMGINLFIIVELKLKNHFLNTFTEEEILDMINTVPEAIVVCKVPDSNIVILLLGFRNSTEKDKYFNLLQIKFHKYVDIVDSHTFSYESLIKLNSRQLFKLVLEEKEIVPPVIKE